MTDTRDDLVERIRADLFGSLCHYRQHCIAELDDAEAVAKFIEAEIERLRALTPAAPEIVEEVFKEAYELGYLEGYLVEPRVDSLRDPEDRACALRHMDGRSEAWSDYRDNNALTAPSTPAGEGMVEVVQADREAAARAYENKGLPATGKSARAGKMDDDPFVQAFARHRLESDKSARKVWEAAAEAFMSAPAPIEARERWTCICGANSAESRIAFDKDGGARCPRCSRALQGSAGVGEATRLRETSLGHFAALAQEIAESAPVTSIYAAPEWGELSEDGRQWVCGLIREALVRAAQAPLLDALAPTARLGQGEAK